MNPLEILIPAGALLLGILLHRNSVDKSKGEPLLCEEALVHAKTEQGTHYYSSCIIHFYIAERDTVVSCSVPEDIFYRLNKGQRGRLCHRGGTFYSFEYDGQLIFRDTTPQRLSF